MAADPDASAARPEYEGRQTRLLGDPLLGPLLGGPLLGNILLHQVVTIQLLVRSARTTGAHRLTCEGCL